MKRAFLNVFTAMLLGAALGAASSRAADKPSPAPAAGSGTAPAAASPKQAPKHTLVFCAPGYPGNTAQAQPAMDAFARAVEKAAGLPAGELGAAYYESEGAGIEALRKPDAVLAVTTLPFYLQDGEKLALKAHLASQRNGSATQQWSLIAQRGRVTSSADLDGWELTGPAGYSPGFVRALLQSWEPLRSSTRITFAPAPLGALRRVAAGENLAVLIEPEQTQAIFPQHPLAKDLEIVATSRPVPGSVVSIVGDRVSQEERTRLLNALMHLQDSPDGAEALKTLRVEKFVTLQPKAVVLLQQAMASDPDTRK
jgi:hypothetical protein